jgi:hypothetical protein
MALQEAERYAGARVRLDRANHDRRTGNLVVAAYTHDSSCPQLHTRAVAANLSYDGVEGPWKALQASGMYERRAYITEVYRNELAREVRGLGYEIESQRNAKGVDNGFEIKGVSKDVLELYSQRSEQRDKSIRQFATERGRQPTDNEVAVLVRESRPDKLHEISSAEVHRLQLDRISQQEHTNLLDLRERSVELSQMLVPERAPAVQSLEHAKEHLFERKTVSKDHELMAEALRHGRGKLDLIDLRGSYEFEVSQGKLLQVGGDVATQISLERERSMVAAVDHGIHRYPSWVAAITLNRRQIFGQNSATP